MEREFNLLDEPWVRVMDNDCNVKEISLKDAILSAHKYKELAGETRSQDVAILRLILAVMHTVFSRYNTDGESIDISEDIDLPIEIWKEIWNKGYIPDKAINKYFDLWHDRFWLFDEKYPFYQSVAVKGKGKPYNTAKMIGSLFESGNKPRLFAERKDDGRVLTYPEAARWLVHIINFDDIAAKAPTPKKTWTGKLGIICFEGNNLFETIMLNYVANAGVNTDVYKNNPSWETEIPHTEFNQIVSVPTNQAALLTLQSRRLYLNRENDKITGYYISGGDCFDEEEVFAEQMTLWRYVKGTKGTQDGFKPMRHDPSKKTWQEFGSIAAFPETKMKEGDSENRHTPGIVKWLEFLRGENILNKEYMVKVSTISVVYDYGQATSLPVIDSINDTLTFHSQLFLEAGRVWRHRINSEIDKCEKTARAVAYLSIDIQKAAGASGDKLSGNDAKIQFYDLIDRPFRLWLAKLNVDECDSDYLDDFEENIKRIAQKYGTELASRVGSNAIFSRRKKEGTDVVSTAEALNKFIKIINNIFKGR